MLWWFGKSCLTSVHTESTFVQHVWVLIYSICQYSCACVYRPAADRTDPRGNKQTACSNAAGLFASWHPKEPWGFQVTATQNCYLFVLWEFPMKPLTPRSDWSHLLHCLSVISNFCIDIINLFPYLYMQAKTQYGPDSGWSRVGQTGPRESQRPCHPWARALICWKYHHQDRGYPVMCTCTHTLLRCTNFCTNSILSFQ